MLSTDFYLIAVGLSMQNSAEHSLPYYVASLCCAPFRRYRSFGILFFEFVTAGSVPYGDFTNPETKRKVKEGYRLPCPVDCPEDVHALMKKCWLASTGARPTFTAILAELKKLQLK